MKKDEGTYEIVSRKETQLLENPQKDEETERESFGDLETDLKKQNGGKVSR